MNRKVFVLLGLAAAVASVLFAQEDVSQGKVWENPDETVATVDGVVLTRGDALAALWDWGAQVAIEELIDQQIILNAAEKKGLSVTAEQVDERVKRVEASLPPGQTMEGLLKMSSMTLERLRSRLRSQILIEGLIAEERLAQKLAAPGGRLVAGAADLLLHHRPLALDLLLVK